MTTHESSTTTIVVGASRGLGRGIATALAEAGRPIVAVARDGDALADLARSVQNVTTEVADATDPEVVSRLVSHYDPQSLVLVAGAAPVLRPLQDQTWEMFSGNWDTDVRMAFHWVREALLRPLRPGSTVITISSGAALQGSPLTGGYAGAKATQRFISGYAQDEANRNSLGIKFTAILPRITPLTELGRRAVEAYAIRNSQTEEEYLAPMGPPVTPAVAGASVLELLNTDPTNVGDAYLLTGAGVKQIP